MTVADVVKYVRDNPGKTIRDFYVANHVKTSKHNKGNAWTLFKRATDANQIRRGPKVPSPSNRAQACYSYFPV